MQNEVTTKGWMCVKFKFYFYLFAYAYIWILFLSTRVLKRLALPHKLLMLLPSPVFSFSVMFMNPNFFPTLQKKYVLFLHRENRPNFSLKREYTHIKTPSSYLMQMTHFMLMNLFPFVLTVFCVRFASTLYRSCYSWREQKVKISFRTCFVW